MENLIKVSIVVWEILMEWMSKIYDQYLVEGLYNLTGWWALKIFHEVPACFNLNPIP